MTQIGQLLRTVLNISIHTALAGCDGRRVEQVDVWNGISIHTALAGCDYMKYLISKDIKISIHTALAGCDANAEHGNRESKGISIHTALAGCDVYLFSQSFDVDKFQSTQPSQAVTSISCFSFSCILYFNPHSPRRL